MKDKIRESFKKMKQNGICVSQNQCREAHLNGRKNDNGYKFNGTCVSQGECRGAHLNGRKMITVTSFSSNVSSALAPTRVTTEN